MYEMNKVLRCFFFFFNPAKRREEKMYNKCVTTTSVSYVQRYGVLARRQAYATANHRGEQPEPFEDTRKNPEQSEKNTSGELNRNRTREMSKEGQHTMELAGSNSSRTTQFSD